MLYTFAFVDYEWWLIIFSDRTSSDYFGFGIKI